MNRKGLTSFHELFHLAMGGSITPDDGLCKLHPVDLMDSQRKYSEF
jgi:hypothetical protein